MTGPHASATPHQPKDVAKYLLPDEKLVVSTRRHGAVLVLPAAKSLPVLVAALWLLGVSPNAVVTGLGLVLLVAALGYLAVHVGEWWIRHFLITQRRVMLISGFVVRTVAVMPLRRITDMTWQETPFGQLLGYGTFRFESAGQDQALSEISYLPHADQLYLSVSELLFGKDFGGANSSEEEESLAGGQQPRRPAPPRSAPPPPTARGRQDTAPLPSLGAPGPQEPPSRWPRRT
ncbi:PH domain-containing protein [Modestobacter sp. I12A-02628]|uniref:PH domain-containing protein n=1 Tax=Goekera deserti TaxID=2497753 RepID=A0A7K3W9M9_9ACTN|nr:PH domain-containing protein [Goekera deserti]MPQ99827.1 PH domain-containing protein [Goekera deserti]NDI49983.1 PH domain-containing protein [Goekera deserti]NEL52540.1 PH domain-containing protein [Goekera deserti]